MNKIITSLALLALTSSLYFGQVGINTTTPKATLDVIGKPTSAASLDGVIPPRLTGDQLSAKTYTSAQTGAIIYATAAATTLSGQVVNITASGFYYFDGSIWVPIAGKGFDKTDDAFINNTTSGYVELSTKADGTARTAGAEFIVKDNGNVGIGTTTPLTKLHISATSGTPSLLNVEATQTASPVKIKLINSFGGGLGQANYDIGVNVHGMNDFVIQDVKNGGISRLVINDVGNVGVGTISPTNKLHVTATADPLKLDGLQTGTQGNQLLTVEADGTVKKNVSNTVVGTLQQVYNTIGTTTVTIPEGSTTDLPGTSITISPTTNVTAVITVSAVPTAAAANAPTQGSINLIQNGSKIASQYYFSADAPFTGATGTPPNYTLRQLGGSSTTTKVVQLTPGTYTFKLQAKSWKNSVMFNVDGTLYTGAEASDVDVVKAAMTIMLYNR